MTPSTLCIARSSLDRTNRSELAQVCLHVCCRTCFFDLSWLVLSCQRAGIITFPLENEGVPPNSPQKLARPGFDPPAEPAREVKTSRRHAARIRAPHMQARRVPLWLRHAGPGRAA
jgi:hypothetical protein